MIITCPNCKKKFEIDPTLIYEEGRDLQCGSCNHVWFYKAEEEKTLPLTLNEDFVNKKIEKDLIEKEIKKIPKNKDFIINEKPKNEDNKIKEILDTEKIQINTKSAGGKFFSYLIVFIISFMIFVILVDTLKTPIINVFPDVEIMLFNLFETLQDIKLFIIDLI